MDGFLDLPLNKSQVKTYIFTADYNVMGLFASQGMQKWTKPKGINFIYGLLIGAGSGGGGGGLNGGGGGGAPGNYVTFIQPAIAIPDELWVTVAFGGIGGNGGNPNGLSGAAPAGLGAGAPVTGLWWDAKGTNNTINGAASIYGGIYYAYITNGGNSNGGTAVAGGTGGTSAGTGIGAAQSGINGFSVLSTGPGNATGANGGFNTISPSTSYLGYPAGGAGGGGRSGGAKAGGDVICPSTSSLSIWNRNLLGGSINGGAGEDGVTIFSPTLFMLPGTGGGANDSGVGGAGGKGGIGCGGGGGGAGSSGGGKGGDGGDGLIILICW
jgi:hypothetical protein